MYIWIRVCVLVCFFCIVLLLLLDATALHVCWILTFISECLCCIFFVSFFLFCFCHLNSPWWIMIVYMFLNFFALSFNIISYLCAVCESFLSIFVTPFFLSFFRHFFCDCLMALSVIYLVSVMVCQLECAFVCMCVCMYGCVSMALL